MKNVRQSTDERFGRILKGIRVGNLDDADEAWLLSKCLFKYSSTKPEMQTREMADFVHREMLDGNVYTILVPTNKKVQILNDAVLNKIPGNIYQLHAKDVQITGRCATLIENKAVRDKIKALDKDPRLTAGLESCLKIKIGSKVMLRRNLDVSRGLCNGAIGEILKFVVHSGNKKKVEGLQVKFSKCTTDIKRVKSEFFIHKFNDRNFKIQREQFPVSLAYAMTVHKAQGLTLEYAMVDCGKDIFDVGQIYVALSRITSSDNLKIVSFNSSKLRPSIDAWNEYIRLGSNSVPSNTSSFNPRPSRKCSVNDIDYVGSRKSTDVMQIIEDPRAVETPCTGTFENKNSVVCYANSTVQSLLNIIPFSSIKDLSELGNISVRHKKCMISSLSALRKEIGHGFHLEERHDPAEFFYYLMGAPAYATLKSSFEIQFNQRYQCSNPICNVVVSDHTYPKVVYDIQAALINRSVQRSFLT